MYKVNIKEYSVQVIQHNYYSQYYNSTRLKENYNINIPFSSTIFGSKGPIYNGFSLLYR